MNLPMRCLRLRHLPCLLAAGLSAAPLAAGYRLYMEEVTVGCELAWQDPDGFKDGLKDEFHLDAPGTLTFNLVHGGGAGAGQQATFEVWDEGRDTAFHVRFSPGRGSAPSVEVSSSQPFEAFKQYLKTSGIRVQLGSSLAGGVVELSAVQAEAIPAEADDDSAAAMVLDEDEAAAPLAAAKARGIKRKPEDKASDRPGKTRIPSSRRPIPAGQASQGAAGDADAARLDGQGARAEDDHTVRVLSPEVSQAEIDQIHAVIQADFPMEKGLVAWELTRNESPVHVVAEQAGRIIGVVMSYEAGGERFISNVGVLAAHRRAGVATDLLLRLFVETRDQPAVLLTAVGNREALGLYQKLGFVETERGIANVQLRRALSAPPPRAEGKAERAASPARKPRAAQAPAAEDQTAWYSIAKALADYAKDNGMPARMSKVRGGGVRLSSWVDNQIAARGKGKLDEQQIRTLKAIPGWSWKGTGNGPARAKHWERVAEALEAHAGKHGIPTRPSSVRGAGVNLASWAENQRTAYGAGKLSEQQIERLGKIPGWTWAGPFGKPEGAAGAPPAQEAPVQPDLSGHLTRLEQAFLRGGVSKAEAVHFPRKKGKHCTSHAVEVLNRQKGKFIYYPSISQAGKRSDYSGNDLYDRIRVGSPLPDDPFLIRYAVPRRPATGSAVPAPGAGQGGGMQAPAAPAQGAGAGAGQAEPGPQPMDQLDGLPAHGNLLDVLVAALALEAGS